MAKKNKIQTLENLKQDFKTFYEEKNKLYQEEILNAVEPLKLSDEEINQLQDMINKMRG